MNHLSMSRRAWIAGLLILAAGSAAHAESFAVGDPPATADRIDFKVDLRPQDPFSDANKVGAPREFRRGEVVQLVIEGTPRKGFHSYPLTKQYTDQAGNISTIKYAKNDDVQVVWPVVETPTESINEDGDFYLEHQKPFTWTQDLYIKPGAKPGVQHLRFSFPRFQVCNKSTCQFGDYEFDVPFTIIDAPVVALTPSLEGRLKTTKPPVELIAPPAKEVAATKPEVVAPAPNMVLKANPPGLWDLLSFILQGVGAGAFSLITPCVFPMIPITVSFFLKQSEKSSTRGIGGDTIVRKGYSPVLLAAVYSTTIALVLTITGVLLSGLVQRFSSHWATNLILGALFFFFALSLFGMYDIVLPSSLGRLTASGEGRGGLVSRCFSALAADVYRYQLRLRGAVLRRLYRPVSISVVGWRLAQARARRAGFFGDVRTAVLRAGAVPVINQGATQERLLAQHRQSGDGLSRSGRCL